VAQKLEKAKIQSVVPKGQAFDVLLNPKEYRLSKSNQFSEVAIPGLSAPLLQFSRGNSQTLTLQLMFDTYDPQYSDGKVEKDKDVRFYTKHVTDLLKINAELHAPPVCQFSWGNLTFIGVLQQADVRCTLFLPSGIPVRATVDVTFKQFFDGKAETGMLQSANYAKHYVVRPGDTLASIAAAKYEDPAKWRPIAEKNNIDDPLAIKPGQLLIIPAIE
jgi:nucleoid-associated protein YgaU